MEFNHYDLGFQDKGNIVKVHLEGTECNVILLDNNNFRRYKNGDSCNYYGGHATSSIYNLSIPSSGFWNLVIDLGGYVGEVRSSVEVIKN